MNNHYSAMNSGSNSNLNSVNNTIGGNQANMGGAAFSGGYSRRRLNQNQIILKRNFNLPAVNNTR